MSSFLGQAALVRMWAAADRLSDTANIRQLYVHTDRVSLQCDTSFVLHKGSKQDAVQICKHYR